MYSKVNQLCISISPSLWNSPHLTAIPTLSGHHRPCCAPCALASSFSIAHGALSTVPSCFGSVRLFVTLYGLHLLQPCPWDSPAGKNTGKGSCPPRGISLTSWSNPSLLCLLHWAGGSLPLASQFPTSPTGVSPVAAYFTHETYFQVRVETQM